MFYNIPDDTKTLTTFKNLRNETLVIADHLYVKIFKLALFNVKLLRKQDNTFHILNK